MPKRHDTFWHDLFGAWTDVSAAFTGDACAMPEPTEVLFAGYSIDGYEGEALVIYRQGRKYYLVEDRHCSCHGLENWHPEEYTKTQLRKALQKRNASQEHGIFGQNREEILIKLK